MALEREANPHSLAMVSNAARRLSFAASAVAAEAAAVAEAGRLVAECQLAGGKVLVCGNGGSAAAAQHFAAEFTGKLAVDRAPLGAVALSTDTSALTAIANDYSFDDVFARQVRALARPGDVVVGLSTSGRSENVRRAVAAARELGASTVVLTGVRSQIAADVVLRAPLGETARVQEVHDLLLHEIAQVAERLVFPRLDDDASADRFDFELREEALSGFRAWLASTGQLLVTTNGVFDLFHAGHRAGLRAARSLGDRLVVLLNSDDSVRRVKGPERPVRPLGDRVGDLASEHAVDHVLVMPDDRPDRLLGQLRPAVHCKGAEYAATGVPEAAIVEAHGGRVVYLDRVEGYSTTAQLGRMGGGR